MGFNRISIRELPTWVAIFKEDGMGKEEMLSDLELIDDLLVLVKSQSLLNRKKNLKAQLSARIGSELGQKITNMNSKR